MVALEVTLRSKCFADAAGVLRNALRDHNFVPQPDLESEAWRHIVADWASIFGVHSQLAADQAVKVDVFVVSCLSSVAADLQARSVWVEKTGLVA
jgi:hypothetical protein